jgi:formamidopyrimidine-DNA glycosylase
MPELPELEVIREQLTHAVQGKTIAQFKVIKPYIAKNYFEGNLKGECVETIEREGKYLSIGLTAHTMVIHLMVRGKIIYTQHKAIRKSAAVMISFTDNSILYISEQGHKKRAALYIVPQGKTIPHIRSLGVDPCSALFTVDLLGTLLRKWNSQLKTFLRTQTVIAGIGNAYADEILWKAQLSPFKITGQINDDETVRLYAAIKETLAWAIEELRTRGINENREFLNVHGKKGSVCPRCNTQIMSVSFRDSDTFYCPTCQTKGKVFKDRRVSKFYR